MDNGADDSMEDPQSAPLFLIHMGSISLFSLAVFFSLLRLSPDSLFVASPFLLLWFLTPIIGWGMNTKPVTRSQKQKLPERDLRLLRHIARRTWRYFEDFVCEETSWLPPDNYQSRIKTSWRCGPARPTSDCGC